jgi:uncharacterized protein
VAFRLIPREMRFYDDFIALGEQIRGGAALLAEMLAPERPMWEKADAIKEVEHTCDNLTHEIIQRLHRTFVTPLDREDIHTLASSLDDVIDAIDEAAANVRLYRLDHVRQEARVMAGIIKSCTDQLVVALRAFERRSGVAAAAVELNRLENEADRIHQNALQRLFDEETDPITIMKWKEVIDLLEEAADRCEDVANVVEGVVVKHA